MRGSGGKLGGGGNDVAVRVVWGPYVVIMVDDWTNVVVCAVSCLRSCVQPEPQPVGGGAVSPHEVAPCQAPGAAEK